MPPSCAMAHPRYQYHHGVDDAHGVITAVETTPGSIAENHRALPMLAQHTVTTDTAPRAGRFHLCCLIRNVSAPPG